MKNNRTKRINARATEEEYQIILNSCELMKYKSLSEFVTDSLVYYSNFDGKKLQTTLEKKDQSMTYEVNKIGVNLNQIARKIHQL